MHVKPQTFSEPFSFVANEQVGTLEARQADQAADLHLNLARLTFRCDWNARSRNWNRSASWPRALKEPSYRPSRWSSAAVIQGTKSI